MVAKSISEADIDATFITRTIKFRQLKTVIDKFYQSAFAPEVIAGIEIVKEAEAAVDAIDGINPLSGKIKASEKSVESKFQFNLMALKNRLQQAIAEVRLKKNSILFIDGIDIRPSQLPYTEYIDCVKGLANSVWELNNSFFPTIRDTPGRLRAVLLVRPDIFANLSLQNQNAKLKDNSVYLDWVTNYPTYRSSEIFSVCDRLLSVQQDNSAPAQGVSWDYYFPFKNSSKPEDSSFISFLRFSFFRPRDIITMMGLMGDRASRSDTHRRHFLESDFNDTEFRRDYSNYLLGEIKDQLYFYYTPQDFEHFLGFFKYLDGRGKFTASIFETAFKRYVKDLTARGVEQPIFFENADSFLQFLYEIGVICYVEFQDRGAFYKWCFRERSYANLYPKVGLGLEYEIHYGLFKALNTGGNNYRRGQVRRRGPRN